MALQLGRIDASGNSINYLRGIRRGQLARRNIGSVILELVFLVDLAALAGEPSALRVDRRRGDDHPGGGGGTVRPHLCQPGG